MSNYNRPGRKRLSVDLPIDIHMKIRISSGNKNCTITKWVIGALIEKLKREKTVTD